MPTLHPLDFIGEVEGIDTGIAVRRWDYDVGEPLQGHTHGMPHATLIAAGRFRFTDETTGSIRDVGALEWIPVAAQDLHGFECLEKGTIFCIFTGRPGALIV
jgi:quercetin dioxygenase-like cupin family protein